MRTIKLLCINMIISMENKIRPKFLSAILSLVGIVLLIEGLYTVGLWLPIFMVAVLLVTTKSENVIALIPFYYLHISAVATLIIGLALSIAWGIEFTISWYITGFILSISFKMVRNILAFLAPLQMHKNQQAGLVSVLPFVQKDAQKLPNLLRCYSWRYMINQTNHQDDMI